MPEIGTHEECQKKKKKQNKKQPLISGSSSTKLQNMIHVSSNTNGLQHSEQVLLQRVSKFRYILNIRHLVKNNMILACNFRSTIVIAVT